MNIRCLSIFLLLLGLDGLSAEQEMLKLRSKVELPGVRGRLDHFAVDVKGQRLFVAALGNNTLEVIDVRERKRLKSVPGMSKPTGVCFLPEKNWIGTANGDKGTFEFIDGESYKVIKTAQKLNDADNVRFDAKRNLVYVGFGSGAIAIIDPEKVTKVGEIKLKGHPESFQLEGNGPRIFINVPDADQIAVIDRDKKSVVAAWPIGNFRANFPMSLDEKNGRMFVGCRNSPQLVVFDSSNGQRVANVEIGGDADDLFYDAQRGIVIISCGEGRIDVVEQVDPNRYRKVQSLRTAPGARTSYFSPDLNVFALAVPNRGAEAAVWIYTNP